MNVAGTHREVKCDFWCPKCITGRGVTYLGLSPKTKLYFDAFPKRQMCIDKYFCIKILKLAEGILPNPAAFTFDEGRKLTNHNQPQPAILGF